MMNPLNYLFKKLCPCLTHKQERDIKKKHKKVKSVKKGTVLNVCMNCGKTINGLTIVASGTSVDVLCARCKDAKSS